MKARNIYIILFYSIIISCQSGGDSNFFDFVFPEDCCTKKFSLEALDMTLDCQSNAEIDSILLLERSIYIPCVFSPDSDEMINRTHAVFTNGLCNDICEVKIYSQDGSLVFENGSYLVDDMQNGWNGMNGNEIVEGPFEVVYQLKCADDRDFQIRGIVCSLLCSSHTTESYFVQGLISNILTWPSQNNGEGGFQNSIPDNCID